MENEPSGRSLETLISIDDSDDSSGYASEKTESLTYFLAQSSVENFEADVTKLKQDSSAKFKKRWEEIIQRYSKIDDDAESDEIDLRTGKITVDNGHLRSLAGEGQMINGVKLHSSIWTGDYDYDKMVKEESRLQTQERRAKHRMREKLKREDKFYNGSPLAADSDSVADSVLVVDQSPTKRSTISPLKRKPSLPAGYISPVKRSLVDSLNLLSPRRDSRGSGHMFSPRHMSSPMRGSYISSPMRSSSHISSPSSIYPSHIRKSVSDNALTPGKLHFGSPTTTHDELYSMVSDLNDNIQMSLYTCAFPGCRFSSEFKSAYRAHLLLNHASELNRIGYPVARESGVDVPDMTIPEMTILKLTLHFPLQLTISPEKPLGCLKQLAGGRCTKSFLSSKQLALHHEKYPSQCSTRRQVLLCPILGCHFMTDGGGEEWKIHVNSHLSKSNSRGDISNNRGELKPKMGIIDSGVMESLDDVFSDTVSSLEFSEDESKKTNMDDFWTPKPATPESHRFKFDIVTSDEE